MFDKSNFKEKWVNQDEMYVVGYDKHTNEKVIAITVPWITWYDIYFKLTDEEFEWHITDLEALNDLASRMVADKGIKFYKERLLLDEGPTR